MQPGVLALSHRDRVDGVAHDIRALLARVGIQDATLDESDGLLVATWGGSTWTATAPSC